ncbi:hypothetical protein ACET68_14495 [Aeromonas rivipollensis]|uniref:hypothetical protein n=1 Tax=Aeromonas rivipollensis TaxID=948519 RepID=UPI0038D0BA3A
MSLFNKREDARVEKPNGDVLGPYKAMFAGSSIIIDDPKADVEEGDSILRLLPNGKDERSFVTEATFYNTGVGIMGPHYQIKFKKGGAPVDYKPVQNIHINNAQSIQIGDFNTANSTSKCNSRLKIRLLSEVRQKPPVAV